MTTFKLKTFLLALFIIAISTADAQQINIATFNLRYKNGGDTRKGNGWEQRMPVIADLIRFHDFEIFGTQEGLQEQLEDLTAKLTDYAYTGVGRNDGKKAGEHAAIFYKKSRFKMISSGNFWLSEKTDVPNRGWDAALPRICSWGQFQDISSGKTFYYFNTHFDHVGVKARMESAKLILRKIQEIAGAQPTILTGDFNVDQNNEIYTVLNGGLLTDAYNTAAIKYATNGTFNHFNINAKTDSRIDHVLLSKGIAAKRYGVLTDSYRSPLPEKGKINTSGNFPKELTLDSYEARLPSDHYPVMVVIEL